MHVVTTFNILSNILTILTIIILVDPNLHPKRNHVWADWGGLSFSTSAKTLIVICTRLVLP